MAQATPNNTLEYFRLQRRLELRDSPTNLRFRVRATNDVHIGLRRLSGEGPDYEIVLGGWNNAASGIRKFHDRNALLDPASLAQRPPPDFVREHARLAAGVWLRRRRLQSRRTRTARDCLWGNRARRSRAGRLRRIRIAVPHRLRRKRRLAVSRIFGLPRAPICRRARILPSSRRDVLYARLPVLWGDCRRIRRRRHCEVRRRHRVFRPRPFCRVRRVPPQPP